MVLGSGKFEEIMVASQEIAGSTAQLVIASRVKAREGSSKFQELRLASKLVTEATGAVVAVAKSSSVTAESKWCFIISEIVDILFPNYQTWILTSLVCPPTRPRPLR